MFASKFLENLLLIAVMLICSIQQAITQNVTVTLDPVSSWEIVRYKTTSGGNDWTVSNYHSIGRHDGQNGINSGSTEDIWRQELKFDLTSISDGDIQSTRITGSFTNYASATLKARIGSSPGTGGTPQIWANVGSGTTYFTDVQYNTNPLNLATSDFTTAVRTAQSSGQIFLGVTSLSEGGNSTYATTALRLEVTYRPKVSVTVRNSFGGGTVKVDGNTVSSGTQFRWLSGSSHTLEATNQPPNNFLTWFNVTTGQQIPGNPITVAPSANTTYQANFSTDYNVTIRNSFNGGFITVDGQQLSSPGQQTWTSGSSHTLLATNQDFAGYFRVFRNWSRPNEPATSQNPLIATANASGEYVGYFDRQFNVNLNAPSYVEGGSGGTYEVNGTNVGATWTGPFVEYQSPAITLEAVPPAGWLFQNWSDGLTTNPRSLIPSDHTSLYAVFKKHLASSLSNATAANNQRKLESFGATEYAVYPSAGSIYFTKNDGSGWSNETRLSFGGTAKNPSIAETYSAPYTVLHVVWEETQWWNGNEYHNVFYRKSTNSGASWQNAVQVSYPPGYNAPPSAINVDATPVVAGSPAVIVWKAGDIYSGSIKIQVEPLFGSSTYFTVDGSSGASTSASLRPMPQGPYKVAFRDGAGIIQYREFSLAGGYPYYSVAFDYGKSADLSSEYWWMSDAANPCIVFDGTRTFVTWDAECQVHAEEEEEWKDGGMGAGGAAQRHVLAREFTTSWQPVVEFAHYNYPLVKPSVGVNMNTNKVVVMWELNGNSVDKVARDVTGGSWGVVSLLDGGVAPNLNHYVYGGNPTYGMYTAGSSAPYSIVMNTNVGTNPVPAAVNEVQQGGEIKDAPQASFVLRRRGSLDLAQMRFGRLPAGAVQGTLWIESTLPQIGRGSVRQPWPFLSDTSDFSEWLSTSSIVMPQDAEEVTGTIRISVRDFRIADSRVPLSTRLFSSDLLTAKGSENSRHFTLGDLATLGATDTSLIFKSNVSVRGHRGKQLRMKVRLVGQDDEQEPTWSTFLAVDSAASSSFKTGSGSSATSMLRQIPVVYDLHANYPNPFNPTTTIKFDLPEVSTISLVVYDVLGRRVAELANGALEAGYHSVTWDARDIASGMYFARFTATDAYGNAKFARVSKLLLAK